MGQQEEPRRAVSAFHRLSRGSRGREWGSGIPRVLLPDPSPSIGCPSRARLYLPP